MPIYNRGGGDVQMNRTGVAAWIGYGHILLRVDVNSAQIGTDGATWLWCNLRSQLARLISYRQVINWQLHIILQWKNVWMYTNLLWKMWWCVWIFIWKNVNGGDFDTNINRDMCMKVNVMFLFIDIKLRVVYKHIYLYHAYCYLHHLCAWWCRCICIRICKCICRWICECIGWPIDVCVNDNDYCYCICVCI